MWIHGHNIAGYLPHDDEPPYPFGTFVEAREACISDMRRIADDIEPGAGDPFGDHYAESLCAAAEDLNLTSNGPFLAYVETGPDATHIPEAWWIDSVDDETAAELRAAWED